jgi:nucleoside-diphosphate-sugar epimerase
LNALSTNLILYNLLIPDSKVTTPFAGFIDVRDVAAAIIRGIKTPGRVRALLTGEWFDLKDAADYIASVRPELKDRLADPARSDDEKGVIDNTRAYEALGLSPVMPWRESVLETIDVLLKVEKDWVAQGIDIENTLKKNDRRQ